MTSREQYDEACAVCGPFETGARAMTRGFDRNMKQMEPLMKAAGRVGAESMGLATKRLRAYAEAPQRFARCRTPADVMQEQMQFWQTCVQDYTDASRKIMTAWSAVVPAMPAAMMWPMMMQDTVTRMHDYMNLDAVMPTGKPAAREDERATRYDGGGEHRRAA